MSNRQDFLPSVHSPGRTLLIGALEECPKTIATAKSLTPIGGTGFNGSQLVDLLNAHFGLSTVVAPGGPGPGPVGECSSKSGSIGGGDAKLSGSSGIGPAQPDTTMGSPHPACSVKYQRVSLPGHR